MVPTVMAVSSGVLALCLIGLTSYLTTNLQSLSSEPKIAWGHGYMDKAYDHLVRKPVKPPSFSSHCTIVAANRECPKVSELADGSHDAPHGTVDEHNATGAVANIPNVTTPAPLPPGEIAVGTRHEPCFAVRLFHTCMRQASSSRPRNTPNRCLYTARWRTSRNR